MDPAFNISNDFGSDIKRAVCCIPNATYKKIAETTHQWLNARKPVHGHKTHRFQQQTIKKQIARTWQRHWCAAAKVTLNVKI